MKQYSIQKWSEIFQVIKVEASKNPMLSPEGMKREKVEDKKPVHQPLLLVYPIPDNLSAEDVPAMHSCIRT